VNTVAAIHASVCGPVRLTVQTVRRVAFEVKSFIFVSDFPSMIYEAAWYV
jgi:hypothetical protein